ncbi:unnamed protein product [Laminaria digitata]
MVRHGPQLIHICGCTLLRSTRIMVPPSTAVRAATAGDHCCSFFSNEKTATRMFCSISSSSSASSSRSGSAAELREFKDRLRPLGPGRVGLSLDNDSGLATLVLDNHERRNALSGRMMVQLSDAVDSLEKWERGVALILHGAGGNFCAGADLSLAREHLVTGTDGRLMCALMTDTLSRLRR